MEQQVDWIAQVFHEPWVQIQQITFKQEVINTNIDASQPSQSPNPSQQQHTILSSYHVQLSNQKQILVSMEHGKTVPISSSSHLHRFSQDLHSSHRFSSTTTNTSASTDASISNTLDLTKPFCLRLYVLDAINVAKEFLRIERAAYTHKHLICVFGIKQIVYQSTEPYVPFTPPSSRKAVNPFSFQFTNPSSSSTTANNPSQNHQYSDYELRLLGMIQLHSKVKQKKWKLLKTGNQQGNSIPCAIWNPFFNQKLFTISQQNSKSGFSLHSWWSKMKRLNKSSQTSSQPDTANSIVLQKCSESNTEGSSEMQSMILYQQQQEEPMSILLEQIPSSPLLTNEEKALLFSFALLIKIANKK